ncbi:MAG: Flagellin protein FlaA [Polyangiaceae bacterium]|jgi:flagellin|nr:Flagellin protein FlaA [Polyangiaceae bacterium]
MPLVIPTNTSSLDAQKSLARNTASLGKSFARLSSGFRINTAADDAAGLAISESMKAQIRSYTIAERNANEAISMTQTAEAALGSMHDILGRMRELAIQSSNGSMTANDRGYLDTEFTALKDEMARIQGSSKFNGKLLVSTTGESITFQVGLDNTASDQITLTFGGLSLTTLLSASTNVAGATSGSALGSIGRIDQAIGIISTERAKYGAAMNRLDVTTSSIQTMRVNLSAANSRIRDVDVAEETSQLARNQVLSQAGVSVLSQANQLPQMAMQLLQG